MTQNVILLVVAMVGLTLFADRFVAGAAQLAARLNVSTVVAGALIIGFGTSAPELVVSTVATLTEGAEGTALGIGNIVGAPVDDTDPANPSAVGTNVTRSVMDQS